MIHPYHLSYTSARNPPQRHELLHTQSTQTKSTVCPQSTPTKCVGRRLRARPNVRAAAFPYQKHMHCMRGIERWMRPCGATRAGTQAPPLPISIKPRGVPLPHRGYTFDSAGLASATQPTLGNDVSEEATPLGVVLFLITHDYHMRRMDYSQMISSYEN